MAYQSPNRKPAPCNFKVVCIDDRNRPSDVPVSLWVKKGSRYTVIGVVRMMRQGVYGFVLKEIDISGCFPYKNFSSHRFADAEGVDALQHRAEELLKEAVEEHQLETVEE